MILIKFVLFFVYVLIWLICFLILIGIFWVVVNVCVINLLFVFGFFLKFVLKCFGINFEYVFWYFNVFSVVFIIVLMCFDK